MSALVIPSSVKASNPDEEDHKDHGVVMVSFHQWVHLLVQDSTQWAHLVLCAEAVPVWADFLVGEVVVDHMEARSQASQIMMNFYRLALAALVIHTTICTCNMPIAPRRGLVSAISLLYSVKPVVR